MYEAGASGYTTFGWLTDSQAHSYGSIAVDETGVSQAWCQLTGHDPYLGSYTSGGAEVESYKPFVIESPTLPDGTLVTVCLTADVSGVLEAREGFTGLSARAYAEFDLNVQEKQSSFFLVEVEGEAEVIAYPDRDEYSTMGAWDGCLTPLGEHQYGLDYTHEFVFPGMVGQEYSLFLGLKTLVGTSDGANSASYYDVFAKTDLWNTGEYGLSSPDDVVFRVIPEPGAAALFAIAVLVFGRRR
ncbi:MAG: hypothetical protein JXO22_03890 [Phycisphaerae bacterium]|nr:hypothetical protein [Phycisphaerae bacterium]